MSVRSRVRLGATAWGIWCSACSDGRLQRPCQLRQGLPLGVQAGPDQGAWIQRAARERVQQGRRVGLLDADVYGPSQPRMLGVSGRPASPDGKTILPLRNHGVTMMSIGLMTNDDQAVVWRGPMLMGALQQMMMQVQWGALDVLLVDLPPGTGDVQMTLSQKAQVDGAIVVSTPQDVALLDARKGIDMFKQLNVPLLGMIENMSTHICSACGHEEHVFGHGGVASEAAKLGVPLLAEIPLDLQIRLASDGGAPIVVSQPDSGQAKAFHDVAAALVAKGVA